MMTTSKQDYPRMAGTTIRFDFCRVGDTDYPRMAGTTVMA